VRIVSIESCSESCFGTPPPPGRFAADNNDSTAADAASRVQVRGRARLDLNTPVAVVIAASLRKEFAGTPLFEGVSFKVERRDRLALAGPNGAGKTTLLRMLAGETGVDGGELVFAKGTRVALHDQRPPLDRSLTLREYTLSGAADLVATEAELRELEGAMASGDHGRTTLRRYAAAQARLEHAGGYDWRERAVSTLRSLGFADDDFERELRTFSGGELTRASLGRALAGDPELLLLDEPTNHLDLERLEWLEETLTGLDAAVVLVAHDRWFLESVATSVLELEGGRSLYFRGPWHEWRREKAARVADATKQADRLAADIARLERFVERFRAKKTKARQAQAKLTQIARLEHERKHARTEVDLLTQRSKRLGFEFLDPPRSGKVVAEAEWPELRAGDKLLLSDVLLALDRGEHVVLVGPNGSGKTTLLERLLAGPLGHGVVSAYFSQQETELDERGSVLECVQTMTGLRRPQAQTLLGRFLFSGWEAHEKPVAVLSGGERRRLALATVVASGANFLVLDEPTNHLDLESREALEAALEAFPGTVLLVSHDRALLDAVAERTLAIEDGGLASYAGGWAEYVRRSRPEPPAAEPKPRKAAKPKPERPKPPAPSPLELVEREIAAGEERVAELERQLAEDWTNVDLVAAHRAARHDLEALFARWETLLGEA
jgi:ATP-binding cassette subfamily F protein 3